MNPRVWFNQQCFYIARRTWGSCNTKYIDAMYGSAKDFKYQTVACWWIRKFSVIFLLERHSVIIRSSSINTFIFFNAFRIILDRRSRMTSSESPISMVCSQPFQKLHPPHNFLIETNAHGARPTTRIRRNRRASPISYFSSPSNSANSQSSAAFPGSNISKCWLYRRQHLNWTQIKRTLLNTLRVLLDVFIGWHRSGSLASSPSPSQ
jgi:hypothetical protein